jgi:hypothetical protein
VIAVMNVLEILKRNAFRVFVHDPSEIEMAVRAAGFERAHEAKTFVWHVEVYSRV